MKMERILDVIRSPLVTEKAARLQENNQYVFAVASDATKPEVKAAIEKLFEVKVESVNLLNVKGKVKTFHSRNGRRSSMRKAYVRLAEGQSIDTLARA